MNESASELTAGIQALMQCGRFAEAEESCRALVKAQPGDVWAWSMLALCALEFGRFDDAAAAAQRAVELGPRNADAWHYLSTALFQLRRPLEAEACSRSALSLNSQNAAYWLQLGNSLFPLQRFDEAAEAYRHAVALEPENAVAWNCLASAEHVRGNRDEATSAYQRCLAIAPHNAEVWLKLAYLLEQQWLLVAAEAAAIRATQCAPESSDAWEMLGKLQVPLGKHSEAVRAFRQSLAIQPSSDTHSRLLQALQYCEGVTSGSLLEAHQAWGEAHLNNVQPVTQHRVKRRESGKRPLRLGFLAADFGRNPIGYLVLPLLEHLDKSRCSIVCYFDREVEDDLTPRFRAAADEWRTTQRWPADRVVDQVVNDEVDVLVDLMGHLGNRLTVFARKPAPVQLTWLGYVGSTGLNAIDYLVADRFHVPQGEEANYVEKILRMPHAYACYAAPDYAPDVTPLPALSNDRVTFGCFNNPAKYTGSALDGWAAVLQRVPSAQLLLKYFGLHEPARQERLRAEFERCGIDGQRILIEGGSTHEQLLAAYGRVDIGLDAQPYSGCTTTCEALWMGVPVVTFPGN